MPTKLQATDITTRQDSAYVNFKHYKDIPNPNPYLNVVQSGQRFKGKAGHQTRVNIYDHYIIHYITSGCGTYVVDNVSYPVQKGDLFLIEPFQFNHYLSDDSNPYTYYWVGFDGLDARELLQLTDFSNRPVINDNGENLVPLFKALYELDTDLIALKHGLNGYLQVILSKLIAQSKHDATEQNPYYIQAMNYIAKHYADPDLNVQTVAKHVGITRSYLYRIFFKANNHSINHSILKVRLSKAVALLSNSTLSIKEIAYQTGFNSQAYFTKQFKREFGCSPSTYRQNK